MSTTAEAQPLIDVSASAFTLWAVLRRDPAATFDTSTQDALVAALDDAVKTIEAKGVIVRGFYDVSSIKADSDIMIWLHGAPPETLQWALRELRRSPLLRPLLPTWNVLGVHREAEFSADHAPTYLKGKEPGTWLTVYPFVRSYEWYLLPDDERRFMLAEHGKMARGYPDVRANTVASFALGDYEWMLAFEADELHRIVDLMRHLRASTARRHVRVEIPFYTGTRVPPAELVANLP